MLTFLALWFVVSFVLSIVIGSSIRQMNGDEPAEPAALADVVYLSDFR